MARVSGPMDLFVPGFNYGGVNFVVPVDLPEGGHLQVIVGENPFGQAIPSRQIPKGCMLAIVPAEVAERLRAGLDELARHVNDPVWLAARSGANGGGSRLVP